MSRINSLAVSVFMFQFLVMPMLAQQSSGGASADAQTLGQTSVSGSINFNAVAILRWYPVNRTATFTVGSLPTGVVFDGADMWVSNVGDGTVTKLRANDGTSLGTFAVGNFPMGMVFDGANIWVAQNGSSSVTKLRASDGTMLGTYTVGSGPEVLAFDGGQYMGGEYFRK